jgi:hypothetical protein
MSSWSIWCPHWWVDELDDHDSPISVGAQLVVPVGFTVDRWRDSQTDERVWEFVGPGTYRIENAPVVQVPTVPRTEVSTWELMLGPLRLSADGWVRPTFQQAKALEIGDRISGQVTLSLDPTHEGHSQPLRIAHIEIQESADTSWERVSRIGSARTRISDGLRILVTCELSTADR